MSPLPQLDAQILSAQNLEQEGLIVWYVILFAQYTAGAYPNIIEKGFVVQFSTVEMEGHGQSIMGVVIKCVTHTLPTKMLDIPLMYIYTYLC